MTEQLKNRIMELSNEFKRMKRGETKAQKAIEVFMQNPVFRDEYSRANDKVKEFEKWTYYTSLLETDEGIEVNWANEQLNKVRDSFTKEDWENLIEITGSNMGKGMFRKQMKAFLNRKEHERSV